MRCPQILIAEAKPMSLELGLHGGYSIVGLGKYSNPELVKLDSKL